MEGSCLQFQNLIHDAIFRIRFPSQSNNLLVSSWDCSLRLYDVDGWVLRLEAPMDSAPWFKVVVLVTDSEGPRAYRSRCIGLPLVLVLIVMLGGWDNKIMLWDTCMKKAPGCVKIMGAEVESMSLSVFNFLVSTEALVNTYDLRMLERPAQVRTIVQRYAFTIRKLPGKARKCMCRGDDHLAWKHFVSLEAFWIFGTGFVWYRRGHSQRIVAQVFPY
ncbi:hypothetical protein PVL29_011928 [Vitis rotundifolia]|uniref:Uncharacterized protein n=1 Tax=Vitis rotundifolia TaxID=103349 RepID=A0AA38ZRE3_VITRO|nr:hypothetical protein PVL29_011928 [Vitis rotundifolia]